MVSDEEGEVVRNVHVWVSTKLTWWWWNWRVLESMCASISNLSLNKWGKRGDCWYTQAFTVHRQPVKQEQQRAPVTAGCSELNAEPLVTIRQRLKSADDGLAA